MVQPFEKALEEIAQNSKVMATQMPIIADSVKKIYEIEKKEDKKEDKKKVEQERIKADRAGGRGPQAKVLKGLGEVTNQLKSLQRLIKKNHKEEMKNSGGGGFGLTDLLSILPGGGILKKLLFRQEGGLVYKSPIQAFQKGGGVYTVPGNSTGDKHPMMLPAGSFVLNRNASKYVNPLQEGGMVPTMLESGEKVFSPGNWDALIPALNKAIPRFQTGGIVEHLHGDPSRKGYDYSHGTESNAHDHLAFSTPELKDYVKGELKKLGYTIGSENDGVHATGSYHYTDQAFDIPWSQFGSGPITEKDFEKSRKLLQDVKDILAKKNGGESPTSASASAKPQKNIVEQIFDGGKNLINSGVDSFNETFNTQIPLIPGKKDEEGNTGSKITDFIFGAVDKIGDSLLGMIFPGMGDYIKDFKAGFMQGFSGKASANSQVLSGDSSLPNLPSDYKETEAAMFRAANADSSIPALPSNYKETEMKAFQSAEEWERSKNQSPAEQVKSFVTPGGRSANEKAVLNAIADAEGTSHMPNNGYNTHFGHSQTKDLSKHPDKTITKGGYSSTAFGRYQFLTPTWNETMGGSMSPERQDQAALKLIRDKRKVDISDGLSMKEIYNLGREWASIEGGPRGVKGGSYGAQAKYTAEEFMKMYQKHGGKVEGKQTGGMISKPLQPVMVESGEKIFSPGSYGPEIPALNDSVPRFQTGGSVNVSSGSNHIHSVFQQANQTKMDSESTSNQPIIVPVPQPMPMQSEGGGGDQGISGSFTPNLSNEPSNHIISTLIMQTYSLMNRIG